jgi:hypothetical protein
MWYLIIIIRTLRLGHIQAAIILYDACVDTIASASNVHKI